MGMIRIISALIREIVARVEGPGRASANLRDELKTFFRDDILKDLRFDSLINKLRAEIEGYAPLSDVEGVYDEFVDRFIDEKIGGKLLVKLTYELEKREGLTERDAEKVLFRGSLDDDLKEILAKYTDKDLVPGKANPNYGEFGKMIYSYIQKLFHLWVQEWGRKNKRKTEKEVGFEQGRDQEVLLEREVEEKAKKEFGWESDLIDNLKRHIDDKAGSKAGVYKAILDNRFITDKAKRKTTGEIGEDFGISRQTVDNYEKDLFEMLKKYLKANPDIIKHVRHPDVKKDEEDSEVPDYQVFMKENPELQSDLYDYLDGQFKTNKRDPSEQTVKALKLFSEGKSVSDVAKALESNKISISSIKQRYFNGEYEKWYHEKQMKKAYVMVLSSLGWFDYDLI